MTAEFGVFHNEALYGDVTLAVILTLFTGIIQLIMGVLYVGMSIFHTINMDLLTYNLF